MAFTWDSHGIHMGFTWYSHGIHMEFTQEEAAGFKDLVSSVVNLYPGDGARLIQTIIDDPVHTHTHTQSLCLSLSHM